MKTAQECLRLMPKDGHSFDYIDWVKEIQRDARESIQIELEATREELKQAMIQIDGLKELLRKEI